jgi:Pentapeptide repeats (8 copies)
MPYNLLMPEKEDHRSPQPWWLSVWQRRWWIALATLFIVVWWLVPPLLYRHTGTTKEAKLRAITDTRTALLAGLVGLGALLTFWLNSRVYRITAQTLEVTEQGQITERYTRAIEQLGQTELAVRLGGIYALERIARDSEWDHPTVMEVLSAFVREESRKHSAPRARREMAQEAANTDTPVPESEGAARPAADIQAAVTVLGRLPHRSKLPRAILSEARLPGAMLAGDLSGALLDGADLSHAALMNSNLSGAVLIRSNLSGALLDGADLSGAQLHGADLSDTTAYFGAPNLSGAELSWANLSRARLHGADLSGAEFYEVNLSDAILDGADLRETVSLTQAQLDGAHGDARTRLPDGLRRPASWEAKENSTPSGS